MNLLKVIMSIKNLLFICKYNKMRSRTAEAIYSGDNRYAVKSAGISKNSEVKITGELLLWADIVFVMENEHRDKIAKLFPFETQSANIAILDIPDHYFYLESALVELIQSRVTPFLLVENAV
jgi:predicted protein tyrosine phosphatase